MRYKISIQDSQTSRRIIPGKEIVTRQQGLEELQQIPQGLNPKLIPITIWGRDYTPNLK